MNGLFKKSLIVQKGDLVRQNSHRGLIFSWWSRAVASVFDLAVCK